MCCCVIPELASSISPFTQHAACDALVLSTGAVGTGGWVTPQPVVAAVEVGTWCDVSAKVLIVYSAVTAAVAVCVGEEPSAELV